MIIPEPLLRPGINFTARAELKYARALHLANELSGRIDEWNASEPFTARLQIVDAHRFEFRLNVLRQPPIDEWSLILGDVLHNFRSVFDNLIWGLATIGEAQPNTPGKVAFPITADEKDWKEKSRLLNTIAPEFLERIRLVQPWVSGVPREDSLLGLLHHLDIVDKHRGLIGSSIRSGSLLISGLDFGIEPPARAALAQPSMVQLRTPVELRTDALLATWMWDADEMHPDPDFIARVSPEFSIEVDAQRFVLLRTFVQDLNSRTREWLDLIYGGGIHAESLRRARQTSEPSAVIGYLDESGKQVFQVVPFVNAPQTQLG